MSHTYNFLNLTALSNYYCTGTHELSINTFAGILSKQLIEYGREKGLRHSASRSAKRARDEMICIDDRAAKKARQGENEEGMLKSDDDNDVVEIRVIHEKFVNPLGDLHWVAQYPKTVAKSGTKKTYTKSRKCRTCNRNTCCFCYQCNLPFCYTIGKNTHARQCFHSHVSSNCRRSPRDRKV